MTGNTLRCLATMLAISCMAPRVRADAPPDDSARVKLSGSDPRLRFQIFSYGADSENAIHTCGNPCRVRLRRGEYRVLVSGGPDQVSGARAIRVVGESDFAFSLPARSTKNIGLGIGIAGPAVALTGLYIIVFAHEDPACRDSCEEGKQRRAPTAAYIGLGVMAAGAVATPVGWMLFASNRKPRFRERSLVSTRAEARAPRIGFGAAPVPGGAAAGVWGRF
jgi:hypothetical protein